MFTPYTSNSECELRKKMVHLSWSVSATSLLPTKLRLYYFPHNQRYYYYLSFHNPSMASSLFCNAYAALSYGGGLAATKPRRRMVAVRAETINPDIRKTEEKVVDAVVVTEISKPVTAYCR